MKKVILLISILVMLSSIYAAQKKTVSVFYKQRKPSQMVLTRIDSLLENYQQQYQIEYYDIEADSSSALIKKLGLPATHFPFALVIDGSFTAEINGKTVSFVHFPLFMKGIGRHEGNWSIADVKKVLDNNKLLARENILPVLNEEEETSTCED